MHWLEARASVPTIQALRAKAEDARKAELERAFKALARGDAPAAVLEALSLSLTNKLMHPPTAAMNGPLNGEAAEVVRRIYQL